MLVARIAAFAIGVIAIIIAVIGGSGLNVSFMVGLAFAVAASANFPALLLALSWRRFNTTGAITGVVTGVVSAIFLVIVSPKVWPGADTVTGSPIGWKLSNPGIVSIPLGFLGCISARCSAASTAAERTLDELFVRSETGLGPSERWRRCGLARQRSTKTARYGFPGSRDREAARRAARRSARSSARTLIRSLSGGA